MHIHKIFNEHPIKIKNVFHYCISGMSTRKECQGYIPLRIQQNIILIFYLKLILFYVNFNS